MFAVRSDLIVKKMTHKPPMNTARARTRQYLSVGRQRQEMNIYTYILIH